MDRVRARVSGFRASCYPGLLVLHHSSSSSSYCGCQFRPIDDRLTDAAIDGGDAWWWCATVQSFFLSLHAAGRPILPLPSHSQMAVGASRLGRSHRRSSTKPPGSRALSLLLWSSGFRVWMCKQRGSGFLSERER